jgi:5-methylcytosine-specific restriction endonuclease McrA
MCEMENGRISGNGGRFIFIGEDTIRTRVKERYPDFEYVDGYTGCESRIRIRCLKCGSVVEKNAQMLRKEKNVTCTECRRIAKKKAKILLREQKHIENEETKRAAEAEKQNRLWRVCLYCGEEFKGERANKKYCSLEHMYKANYRRKELSKRKRLKDNGKIDYSITIQKLIKRDRGICSLCGKKVNMKDYTVCGDVFTAGNYYPSIDHTIAIANGGMHTWDNVRLAHRLCNSIKSDKQFTESSGGQLMMHT